MASGPTCDGFCSRHTACQFDNGDIVKRLIDAKADVNAHTLWGTAEKLSKTQGLPAIHQFITRVLDAEEVLE